MKGETTLSDAEWEEKFNTPRNRLLKEIFGDTSCPVKDISPKVVIKDENWDRGNDFMVNRRPRFYKSSNSEFGQIASWNDQMRTSGKIVSQVEDESSASLKEKPELVK